MSYYEQSTFGAIGDNYTGAYGGFDGQSESVELRETLAIDGKGGVLPALPAPAAGGKEGFDPSLYEPMPAYQGPQTMMAQPAVAPARSMPWIPIAVLGALAVGGGLYIMTKNRTAET